MCHRLKEYWIGETVEPCQSNKYRVKSRSRFELGSIASRALKIFPGSRPLLCQHPGALRLGVRYTLVAAAIEDRRQELASTRVNTRSLTFSVLDWAGIVL